MRDNEQKRCIICEFSEHFCDCKDPHFVTEEEFDYLQALKKPVSLEDMKAAYPGHPEERYHIAIEMGLPHPYVMGISYP